MFQKYPNNPGGPQKQPQTLNGHAADSLLSRVAGQASYASYVENETDFPVATGSVHADSEVGTNDAVAEIPLSKIVIYPGMATYSATSPLITSDGAAISATGTGSWGQLYAAGRMP
jgi:hypothetical protein